jgi:replicative DNA helicase
MNEIEYKEKQLKQLGYESIGDSFRKAKVIIDKYKSGELVPLKTSIKAETDILYGLLPDDQVILAGRSGSGKTSRAIAMIDDFFSTEYNPVLADKVVVIFDSWEISTWRTSLKLFSRGIKQTARELLDFDVPMTTKLDSDLKDIYLKYKDNTRFHLKETSDNIQTWVDNKIAIAELFPFGEYQVVNIIDHPLLTKRKGSESDTSLLNEFMSASVQQRKQLHQVNIFLSQMNRNIETSSSSRNTVGNTLPQASDLSSADSLFQASDIVLALHRPASYGLTEFKLGDRVFHTGLKSLGGIDDNLLVEVVLKNRNGDTGIVLMHHDIKYNQFRDYTEDQNFKNSLRM